MKNYNHALLVMEKHDYPAEAREVIIRTEEKIIADEKANKIYEAMYKAYWVKKQNFDKFHKKVLTLLKFQMSLPHSAHQY